MSGLVMVVNFDDGQMVELIGSEVAYWISPEQVDPVYVGPIEGLPSIVLQRLIALKIVRVH